MKMNLQLLRICFFFFFFFLQYLADEKRVEAVNFEWKKYPASVCEPDDELMQGLSM